jgi:hypothetical protein
MSCQRMEHNETPTTDTDKGEAQRYALMGITGAALVMVLIVMVFS